QPPIPGEARGIPHVLSAGLSRMGGVILDMSPTIAVALPAGDAQRVLTRIPLRAAGRFDLEGGAMTFQTSRGDEALEVDLPVQIARTVDPALYPSEIGNRQLEQETVFPVEIGLPFSSRPDHQIEALRPGFHPARVEAGLIEG